MGDLRVDSNEVLGCVCGLVWLKPQKGAELEGTRGDSLGKYQAGQLIGGTHELTALGMKATLKASLAVSDGFAAPHAQGYKTW